MLRLLSVPRRLSSGVLGVSLLSYFALALLPAWRPVEDPPIDFGQEVRPILAQHCYACHGPDEAPRKAKLRFDLESEALRDLGGYFPIVRGKSAESEMILRIMDERDPMPPKKADNPISAEDLALLRRWIDEGANWEEHWAFVAAQASEAPKTLDANWPRNAIDAFVLAGLEAKGLRPEAEAAPHALLRRASLDITGLPPSLEELDAFLADDQPGAYEREVDRLLASPRYGEHMARSWLDAARFGDTHGLSLDNERSIWPYRDWVIRAFNENLPFDRFTSEQIAGDLLPESTLQNQVATGFLRCNPTTSEEGVINREYLVKYAVDRVATVSTVWMGLTMGCAQCHDHKFDPISQKEYYEFFALFGNMAGSGTDGNALAPPPSVPVPSPEQAAEFERLSMRVGELEAQLAEPEAAWDAAQASWERASRDELQGAWVPLQVLGIEQAARNTWQLQLGALPEGLELASLRLVLPALGRASQGTTAAEAMPPGAIGLSEIELMRGYSAQAEQGAHSTYLPRLCLDARSQGSWGQGGSFSARNAIDSNPLSAWVPQDFTLPAAFFLLTAEPAVQGGMQAGARELTPTSDYRLSLQLEFLGPLSASKDTQAQAREQEQRARELLQGILLFAKTGPEPPLIERGRWSIQGPLEIPHGSLQAAAELRPLLQAAGTPWRERAEDAEPEILKLKQGDTLTGLRREFTLAAAEELELSLSTFRFRVPPAESADLLEFWLNGRRLQQEIVPLGFDQDRALETRIRLPLQQGTNRLEVLALASFGYYAFSLREPEDWLDGQPIAVLTALEQGVSSRDVREHFRRHIHPEGKALAQELERCKRELRRLEREIPRCLVAEEQAEKQPIFLLHRGQYDEPGEEVQAGTPAVLPPLGAAPGHATRLDLARWLTDPAHPLTARVAVNRFWQEIFGSGLVQSSDNFGVRGDWPSHPELLDDLAARFVKGGWDVKLLLRQMLTSASYRQASTSSAEKRALDPENRLLSRAPRARLDAERIRDAALFLSGKLVEHIGGPSVRPYQPPGLWKPVAYTGSNTEFFQRDVGSALYRRSLYTFWKRTSPPPSMLLFDAPTREFCVMRRSTTNTPLQALVMLNDEQFIEAARGLAESLLNAQEGSDASLASMAFRKVTSRTPSQVEVALMLRVLHAAEQRFQDEPAAALELVSVGESAPDPQLDVARLASWTMLAHLLLNLDEFLTKS